MSLSKQTMMTREEMLREECGRLNRAGLIDSSPELAKEYADSLLKRNPFYYLGLLSLKEICRSLPYGTRLS